MHLSLNQFITLLLGLGTFIAIAAFVIIYWKQGGFKVSEEVLKWYKEQVGTLKIDNDKLRDKIRDMENDHHQQLLKMEQRHSEQMSQVTQQLGAIQGELKEKDKKITEYVALLQSRDPKSLELQEAAIKAIEKINGIYTAVVKKE